MTLNGIIALHSVMSSNSVAFGVYYAKAVEATPMISAAEI